MTAFMTNEELAEIEKRHAEAEVYYAELEAERNERESRRFDLRPQVHQDRAALLAHITSLQSDLQGSGDDG